jgi:hypothetical protein
MRSGIATAAAIVMLVLPASLARAQTPQERIDAAMARAREAGIPAALLESKVAEGRAKGVSMDRIAGAVERREVALEDANQALQGQQVGLTGLALAADAVESGVSQVVLQTLIKETPQDRRLVALAALSHLVENGQAPPVALKAVQGAMGSPEALVNLLNLPPQAAGAGAGRGGRPNTSIPGATGAPAGVQTGPPAAVPAPGTPPQAGRPGGPPANRGGRPTTTPGGPANPGGTSAPTAPAAPPTAPTPGSPAPPAPPTPPTGGGR